MISPKQLRLIEILGGKARRCLPELCDEVTGGRACTPHALSDAEFQEALIQLAGAVRPDSEDSQMPTSNQLKLIHMAAHQVGLDDARYRLLLGNVADEAPGGLRRGGCRR
jgi:hypothetical protein